MVATWSGIMALAGGEARVVLGKDTRLSSYMFESALTAGLVVSGADVYMLHVIPTPGLAYETADGRFDCGIMISTSHNPIWITTSSWSIAKVTRWTKRFLSWSKDTLTAANNYLWRWAILLVPPLTTCRVITAILVILL